MTGPPKPASASLLAPILAILLASPTQADDSALSLADLEAYRVALSARPDQTAAPVRFRDLWDRPEAYSGRPVRVEGRVARLFRQPRIGEFPPLAEAWIVSEAGDPSCLVFPAPEGRPSPAIGSPVRFSGTFLKRLRYQSGDVPRLAPLIVGPEPPSTTAPMTTGGPSWSTVDWTLGLGAASVVALVLARKHLAGSPPTPAPFGPPPRFLDGKPGPDPEI